jgi:hypothetical protein
MGVQLMPAPSKEKQPAQVPGDAESPPRDETDQTIEKSIRHTDKTEPVQGNPKESGKTA